MTVSVNPTSKIVPVGDVITITVQPANSAITTILDPNSSNVVNISDQGNGVFEVTATQPYQGQITFQQAGEQDETVDIEFTALDTITVAEGDVIEKFLDDTVELNISGTNKTWRATSSVQSVATVSKRGQKVLVNVVGVGQTDIEIAGNGINTKTVSLTIKDLQDMVITGTGTETAEINNDINVSVTTPSTPVTNQLVSNPVGAIQVVDDGANGFTLSSSQAATGTLTFQSPNYKDKVVNVSFTLPNVVNDVLNVALNPGDTVEVGQTITATVTGTTKQYTAQSDNGDITVNKPLLGPLRITATQPGSANITLQGNGIVTKTFSVTFTPKVSVPVPPVAGPQFSVANTTVNFNESDVFKDVDILNLVGNLTAKSSDPLLVPDVIHTPTTGKTVVRLELDRDITQDLNAQVTLSVVGQQDVVLDVTVVNDVTKLPTMSMDGKTYQADLGQEVLVQGPTPNPGDTFTITADPNVSHRVDVDRIFLQSAVKGDYPVKIELKGYQEANITFKAVDPVVIPPQPPKPWFDLGPAPSATVIANEDNYVDKVYDSPALPTDENKIAYILENGSADIKGPALTLCQYQEEMGKGSSKDLNKSGYGAKQNFKLYARLISMVKSSDYYSFRTTMRLVLKIFKIYKDDAFKSTSLNRFELDWPADTVKLDEYKMLTAFLCEYVDKNGVGVTANGLPFDDDIKARFNRFIQENLLP